MQAERAAAGPPDAQLHLAAHPQQRGTHRGPSQGRLVLHPSGCSAQQRAEICCYLIFAEISPRTYLHDARGLIWHTWLHSQMRQRGMGDQHLVEEVVKYVRKTWPYWNKTGGARHLIIHTGGWVGRSGSGGSGGS